MTKRVILVIIVGLFLLMLPLMAIAEIVDSGTCGDNLTWMLDGAGKLTISGTGEMPDYDSLPPWYDLRTSITSVEIADGVQNIGASAFENCTSITSIRIGNDVTNIGFGAFYGCTNMTNIDLSDSITSIANRAFENCISLTEVSLPSGVSSIPGDAFFGCTSLTMINVSANNSTFSSLDGILIMNETIILIYPQGREDETYTIPDGITSTNFARSKLKYITLPDGVTGFSFNGCTDLRNVNIPNTVTTIGISAFKDCSSLTSISIPNSVVSIGDFAFSGCTSLKNITIPNSVTSIGKSAFESCKGLTSFIVPNSCNSITGGILGNCSNLKSITIPESITSINVLSFSGCYSLSDIYYLGTQDQWNTINFINGDFSQLNIHCALGKGICGDELTWVLSDNGKLTISGTGEMPDYSANMPWYNLRKSITSVEITDGVQNVGRAAFEDCTNITSVKIGNNVTSIGASAFSECTNMTSIDLSDSVTSISNWAFGNCTSLTEVFIPSGVASIVGDAFAGCTNLTMINVSANNNTFSSLDGILIKDETIILIYPQGREDETYTIPDGITSTNFARSKLKYITLPNGVTSFSFLECTDLRSVNIPDTVTSIGVFAFRDCVSLTSISIPNSVVSIGDTAFMGCTSLKDISIPNSVVSISNSAFSGCSGVSNFNYNDQSIELNGINGLCLNSSIMYISDSSNRKLYILGTGNIPDSLGSKNWFRGIQFNSISEVVINRGINSIGNSSFEFWENLTSVTIPQSITSIGNSAFGSCSRLVNVNISNGLSSIGENAFSDCSSLTSILLPESVNDISINAFTGCSSLSSISVANENLSYSSQDGILYNKAKTELLVFPQGKNGEFTVPNSVTRINDIAFFGCINITNIIISDEVTSIGSYAFWRCSNLTTITIPSSIISIEENAFLQCNSLGTVLFMGTEEQWNNIAIAAGNDKLLNAEIIFNYVFPCVHELSTHAKIDATCYEAGTEAYWTCDICEKLFSDAEAQYEIETPIVIPALGHDFVHHDAKASTCTAIGWDAYDTCARCNYTTYVEKAALGHDLVHHDAKAPTCTAIGWDAYDTCLRCDYTTYVEKAALGHDPVHHEAKAPTCTAIGWDAYDTCSRCDYTTYIEKNALGHSPAIDSAVAPTYTESGLTEGSHCSVCNTVIIPQEEIPPIAIINSGDCGPTMTWILYEDGKLIISGSGYMTSHPWDQGMIKSVEIQEGIRNIVDHAFYRCPNITNVSLPNSLSIIGAYAFQECTGITSISLPDELTIIDDQAFLGCSNLTNILLPESITSIGNSTFCSCSSLVSIIIPDGVSSIGEWCFMASGISDIYANVGSKGAKALGRIGTPFRTNDGPSCYLYQEKNGSYSDLALYSVNDTSITAFEVPSFVTSIYSYAFKDCSNLTQVIIPVSVEEIGSWAFLNCSKLAEITIPDKISRIEEGCFFGSGLETINLPETVTSIGSSAFYNCPMTSIVLPNNIEIIEGYAFNNCNYLDNIIFPESLNHIGSNAFKNCYELKTISVNASLSNIDTDAFTNCFYLTEIKIPACNSYAISWFTDNGYEGALTITPHALSKTERIDATCIAKGIEAFWCCDVCGKLFADEAATTEIEAPLEIPALGHDIVHNEAKEPTCTEAGWEEYETCSRCDYTTYVERVPLGHDWNTAEYKWAENNASLTAIRTCKNDVSHKETETVNVTVVIISPTEDKEGFAAYTSAEFTNEGFNVQTKNVEIPALKDMSVINLPSMLTAIEDEAFENLACEAIIIPNGCTSIGNHAFRNCKNLKYIRVPANVEIPSNAFDGCANVVVDRKID